MQRGLRRIAFQIFVIVLHAVALNAMGAPRADLPLNPTLTTELNSLLRTADGLHKSLLSHNEEQIELSLRDLHWQINRAKSAVDRVKLHEQGHLRRILEAAEKEFEISQTVLGEEKRSRLERGFYQLVNLVQIYRLDRAYSIFFCPKDRSTWVQKGASGSNPFRAESSREPCAIRVSK